MARERNVMKKCGGRNLPKKLEANLIGKLVESAIYPYDILLRETISTIFVAFEIEELSNNFRVGSVFVEQISILEESTRMGLEQAKSMSNDENEFLLLVLTRIKILNDEPDAVIGDIQKFGQDSLLELSDNFQIMFFSLNLFTLVLLFAVVVESSPTPRRRRAKKEDANKVLTLY